MTRNVRILRHGRSRRDKLLAAGLFALCLGVTAQASAFSNVAVGSALPPAKLPTLDGQVSAYFDPNVVSLFIFFRPQQEFSRTTLRQLAKLHRQLQREPVQWVAIVSDWYPRAEVKALIKQVGLGMPVLIDHGDRLYGQLGVIVHPSIGITLDELLAYEPFRKVNYMTVVEARLAHALGKLNDEGLRAVLDPKAVSDGGDDARARRFFNFARRLYTLRSYEAARTALERSAGLGEGGKAFDALSAAISARLGECDGARTVAAKIGANDDPTTALYRAEVKAACDPP